VLLSPEVLFALRSLHLQLRAGSSLRLKSRCSQDDRSTSKAAGRSAGSILNTDFIAFPAKI
jgi:hypothetical protein